MAKPAAEEIDGEASPETTNAVTTLRNRVLALPVAARDDSGEDVQVVGKRQKAKA